MKVISIAGWACSGKTIVAKIFEKYGFSFFSTSDIIRELVKKEAWDPTDLIGFGAHYRKKHENYVFMKRIVEEINRKKLKKVVIESVRTAGENKFLRETFKDDLLLIGIIATKEKRFERAYKRKRIDEGNVELREKREKEDFIIDEIIRDADIIINNNDTLEDLEKNVEHLIRMIK